ncbi:MAG: tRNA (adenosine(37)-N6)-dimethylallyltransferase MiaA [Elusimicrobiota bacterium]
MASASVTTQDILAVVGPTASGKTDLALALARKLNGEIVSADMGQMYRCLDAGTAKPEGRWTDGVYRVQGIPYHLVDNLDPGEPSDAGSFARAAQTLIEEILRRRRRPIIAGGSGLYIRALFEGLDDLPPGDRELRARLQQRALREGNETLHAELSLRDPRAARRIPAGNTQRLIRALEVLQLTGKPISDFWSRKCGGRSHSTKLPVRYLGPEWSAAALNERILQRAEIMFPNMIREAAALVPARYSGTEPGFRCLGYPEALACARGELSAQEGLARMASATRAYAKRQRTWFRNQTSVLWRSGGNDHDALAETFLRELGL